MAATTTFATRPPIAQIILEADGAAQSSALRKVERAVCPTAAATRRVRAEPPLSVSAPPSIQEGPAARSPTTRVAEAAAAGQRDRTATEERAVQQAVPVRKITNPEGVEAVERMAALPAG